LVIGVIIILFGVAVQPSIATIQPENKSEEEYFSVITEFIGLDKNYTTELTKVEIKRLDDLFDSISNNLNKSDSLEKNIDIFKQAVIELHNFGLLGDIEVDEAEKLVTNYYHNPILMKNLKRIFNREKGDSDDKNMFCLISGEAINLAFVSTLGELLAFFVHTLSFMAIFFGFFAFYLFMILAEMIRGINVEIGMIIPLCLARSVVLYKTLGYITTYGILGHKYYEGKLVGKMRTLLYDDVGIIGFTGIKIEILTYPTLYFIGFAPLVNIKDS
jgi:hypothetical protein